jgi:hypothetical protein
MKYPLQSSRSHVTMAPDMPNKSEPRIHIRIGDSLLRKLDELRVKEVPPPSRQAIIRRMIAAWKETK